jgi:probable HAF family extracellular repeat protein
MDPEGNATAFLWHKGKLSDLGLGGSNSIASGINDRGQIVGSVGLVSGEDFRAFAFLWKNGVTTNLGTLGGTTSIATAVNNRGQVVGLSKTSGDAEYHAFLWSR